ncbi:hypothetical protein L9F63_023575 [Diploptera punctata]|uniref:C2H2-type domain-containing protein n=1 Tax=Diploptera punctata TaxID=6984 RepID=A0AAD8E956_DIPPU|nr:hypothetical protein L9F63_023575 [Diploptera punctata]
MTSVYNVGDETDENTHFNPASFLNVTYNENVTSNHEEVSTEDKNFTKLERNVGEKDFSNKLQKRNQRLATFKTPLQTFDRKKKKTKHQSNAETSHHCCTFCDKYFTQKHLLRRHMKLHVTAAVSKDVFRDEIRQEKSGEIEDEKACYKCETCAFDCKCKSDYLQHKKIHKKEEKKLLSCHLCNKEFKFYSLLTHHIEGHKTKARVKKSLSCNICGKKYTKSGSLIKHALQHEGKGTFRCRPCGEVFTTEAERLKHRNEKHEKPWKCNVCNHMFATQEKLDSHIKWHENKETEVFICNVCGKEFKLKVNLKVHVESRCGTDPQHVCSICGKAFMTRGTLVTHALLHTGEKTFLCRFCGKSFRLKVEMQRHERSHTGEKPFVCKVCNKAFAHRESLVTHNTLHTGIRPYMCEACGSTFSCIGNLIKHRKTHRNRCALVTSSNKSKIKSNSNQLGINDKQIKTITDHCVLAENQKGVNSDVAQNLSVVPTLTGSCNNYRTSSFEENNEWVSPLFGNREQVSEQIPSVVDRFNPVGNFHPPNMERNIKSSQFYWGSTNIANMHSETMQTFGMYKELKADARCLPYPCSSDGLLTNNGKHVVGNFFQNFDNHKFQNYSSEKLTYDCRFQNSDHDKFSYNHKLAADFFQYSSFKQIDSLSHNAVSLKESYHSNEDNVNPPPQIENFYSSMKKHNGDDVNVASENEVSSFSAQQLPMCNNIKEGDIDNQQNASLSEVVPETESQEADESNFESPLDECSDNEFLEPEAETTSKFSLDCSTVEKTQTDDILLKEENNKSLVETNFEPFKKIHHERKQKYPLKCDLKDEKMDVISDNSGEIWLSCSFCNLDFTEEHLLSEHMLSHDSEKNEETHTKENSDSDEDEPLDKRLERQLKKVKLENSNFLQKKFLCQYCNKYFEFASQLNRHRKSHSAEEKAATPCRHCGKKYTSKACLLKHESQHTNNGVFKCRQCNNCFSSKQEYRSHRTKQHRKQWSCSECHRSFSNSSNLKNHYNNKHLGREAKSFACNICGKLFKQKGNLKVHVDSRCGSEPRHMCNICGKAFMSGGSLGTHLLLHTGEKTFLCRFCGKSYRLKVEMQRHERSHTGEKPFVCKICNKAFAHRESLVTHNTLHTGVRPYMCEACGSTFSCIGNLIKHRQTHNRRCDISRQ